MQDHVINEAAAALVKDINNEIGKGREVYVFIQGRKKGIGPLEGAKMAGNFVDFVMTLVDDGPETLWKFRVDQVVGFRSHP
jgi:hypothetical protein